MNLSIKEGIIRIVRHPNIELKTKFMKREKFKRLEIIFVIDCNKSENSNTIFATSMVLYGFN